VPIEIPPTGHAAAVPPARGLTLLLRSGAGWRSVPLKTFVDFFIFSPSNKTAVVQGADRVQALVVSNADHCAYETNHCRGKTSLGLDARKSPAGTLWRKDVVQGPRATMV